MKNVYKKGISLVALAITIIVLIILTGAVILTGMNMPKGAQLAVFYNNVSQIQDAVTIKMVNNTSEYMNENVSQYKWVGVATGYTETDARNGVVIPFRVLTNGPTEPLILIDKSVLDETTLPEEEKTKYYVDEKGIVYYAGFEYEGNTYYNRNTQTEGTDKEIIGDITRPTVNITADTTDITNVSSITYTIVFSEPVVGFTVEDIVVENGTKGAFTKVNETTYTIVVTNSIDCIQTVRVPEGCCTDIANNQNVLGSKVININRTVPVVTIEPNGSNGTLKNIDIKITASGANALRSNNEYQYCLTTNETLQGNEEWTTYTSDIPFTIGTGLNGTYYVHTKVIYDIAGNYSEAVKSNPFIFDNTKPALNSINVTTTGGTYKAGTTVTVVATYNENVYGNVNKGTVTSTTAPTLKIKFGTGTARNATFNSASGKTVTYTIGIQSGDNGALSISEYTGTIYDIAGNSLAVQKMTLGGNAITADTTAPSIGTITGSGNGSNITLKSTVTDSVGVTGYAITTNTSTPSAWTAVTSTTSWSASVPTTNTGTTYLHVKDNVGNSSYKSVNICTGQVSTCNSAWGCNNFTSYYKCSVCAKTIGGSPHCPSCGSHNKTYGSVNVSYQLVFCSGCGRQLYYTNNNYIFEDVSCYGSMIGYCAHNRNSYHVVSCGHGKTSSHKYCSHNSNAVYHIY